MGEDIGQSEEVPTSLHDYVAIEQKSLGHKVVSQTTNMKFILTANAKAHPSDGHAGLPTPNLNIKRWKRRARQVNQLSALSQVSRPKRRTCRSPYS